MARDYWLPGDILDDDDYDYWDDDLSYMDDPLDDEADDEWLILNGGGTLENVEEYRKRVTP